jgi:hypothetical protein
MATQDQQFRLGVLAGGIALAAVITYMRFCGSVSLPPKPPPPQGPHGSERELLARSTASPVVYQHFLERDASAAGLRVPTVEEMSRKLAYRVDEARHVLELGQPPIDLAGLRIHIERTGNAVVMVIQNRLPSDVAYEVTSAPSTGTYGCASASPLPFNAMVIARGGTETRTECSWRTGEAIIVTKVETMEVSPLSSWYLSQLPPEVVGVEHRIARGHRGVRTKEPCTPVMPQVVRSGLENGQIGWRDLVDFYARHRCQTYEFPVTYRALKSDGERPIPAVDASM